MYTPCEHYCEITPHALGQCDGAPGYDCIERGRHNSVIVHQAMIVMIDKTVIVHMTVV